MTDKFTQKLFYTSITLLGLGTIFFTMEYPGFQDDMLITNLWTTLMLFGTIFLILTIITIDYNEKKKEKETNQPKKRV